MAHKGPWFRKQTGAWYVQVAGRQVNLGRDKAEAHRQWHKLKGRHAEGSPLGNHRVREILDDYWGWLQAHRGPETCERRKPILKTFGESLPARLRVMELRPFHVQKWLDKHCAKCNATTQSTRIGWLKAAINWSVRMGYAESNTIAAMEKPTPLVRQEFVPADQWPKLLAACKPDLRDFLTIILDAGARVQEMFKYEAEHFDGTRLILPIIDSKGRKRSRVVNLPPVSLEIVTRLAKEYPTGKLFRTARGDDWDRNKLRCRFRPLKKTMEMPGLCATTLRHSFAYHRLTSKQDSLTVAKLMGHVDTRMVASRYGHLEDSEYLAAEANRIGFPSLDGGSSTYPGQPAES